MSFLPYAHLIEILENIVEVLLDKSQPAEEYSSADFIAPEGIPTRIDAQRKFAYNKIMVIDAAVVITGPFNFTKGAERKAIGENHEYA